MQTLNKIIGDMLKPSAVSATASWLISVCGAIIFVMVRQRTAKSMWTFAESEMIGKDDRGSCIGEGT